MEERRQIDRISTRVEQVATALEDCQIQVHQRLVAIDARLETVDTRLAEHQLDVNRLSGDMEKIHKTLLGIHESMKSFIEIIEVWNNAKGFGNFIRYFSVASKVLLPISFFLAIVGFGGTLLYNWLKNL